jgi:hypothetical protein
MGYDPTTETKTLEHYIERVTVDRDRAMVSIFEAVGAKATTPNNAGVIPHIPDSHQEFTATFAEIIGAGIASAQDLLSLDAQLEAWARAVVALRKGA